MPVTESNLEDIIVQRSLDYIEQMAIEFVERCKARCPTRSYDLQSSNNYDAPSVDGDFVTVHVYNDSDHARYVNEGTGVYIGEGPITSPVGGLMTFFSDAMGHWVSKYEIQGMPGNHFWDDTLEEWPDIVSSVGG